MAVDSFEKEKIIISKELNDYIKIQKTIPGSLITILHKVQEEYDYLPGDVIIEISKITNIPIAQIYGIATFYHFFKLQKPGIYNISICFGTACYLKGADDILKEFEETLKIKSGQVTEDGLFSIQPVRCLGCCGLAPVISINGNIYGKVSGSDVHKIINQFQKES